MSNGDIDADDEAIEAGLRRVLSEVDTLMMLIANKRMRIDTLSDSLAEPEPRTSTRVATIHDVRISEDERDAMRTAVTNLICPMCKGKGMVTPTTFSKWERKP